MTIKTFNAINLIKVLTSEVNCLSGGLTFDRTPHVYLVTLGVRMSKG